MTSIAKTAALISVATLWAMESQASIVTTISNDPFAALRGDKCEQQVIAIAKGLAKMWDGALVLTAEFAREDEDREYDIAIDSVGIDTYKLVLSNDSAYSCIFLEMTLTQSGA